MSTEAQILANQANAQLSSGPRTEEGKERSRYNSVTHGLRSQAAILPGEDPEEFASLKAALYEDCRPEGAREQFCVDQMALSQWRLRRVAKLEESAFAGETPDPKQLSLVIRYETSLTRAYYKASKELEHLQSARAKTAARDQKTEEKARKTEEKARMSSFEAQLQAYLFAPPPVLTAEEEDAALEKLASLGNPLNGNDKSHLQPVPEDSRKPSLS
ncbi:MAG: hypothetical protein ACRD7E_28760 [Bryobacteraceae bacterium]